MRSMLTYSRLDSNYNYFKKGLLDVQRKLEHRFYISVAPFAIDIGQALNEVVFSHTGGENDDFPPKPVSEPLNVKDQARHKATQKDKLARAKRIIKSITLDLLEVATKEADLGIKVQDDERQNISSILDNCLQQNAESAHSHTDGDAHEHGSEAGADDDHLPQSIEENGQGKNGVQAKAAAETEHEDVDMADDDGSSAPANKDLPMINEMTNGDADAGASQHAESHDGGDAECTHAPSARNTPGLNLPALSNSGSTNHSTTTHEPLTPPEGEKDLSTFSNGGIPWYLEPFEPEGTTIHDPDDDLIIPEHEPGRDSLREISEELSELDDEAVNGLVDHIKEPVSVVKGNTLAVPTVSPKKKAKSKRRR
jgi:NuA3 HAT complex component NTO1